MQTQNLANAIYHIDSGDGTLLCRCETDLEYTQIPLADAETSAARLCRNCRIAQQGREDTRPCPRCTERISVSHWPQHFRACTGDPTDAAEQTDPDGDPAITETDTDTQPQSATRSVSQTSGRAHTGSHSQFQE